ncbi:MAG TPA: hypothetical protein VKU85_21425 [bacterium]|nr:hypothetical protein [bacterium]
MLCIPVAGPEPEQRPRARRIAAGLLAAALAASVEPAFADRPPAVEWRDYDRAAFQEAEKRGAPVLLWLTAPWNRDHFLLPETLFADPDAVEALNERTVPVRADATVYPELRSRYRISSGLLPSLHFLDADARPHLSVPPVDTSELLLFLSEAVHDTKPAPAPTERLTWEVTRQKFANRLARQLVSGFHRGGYDLAAPHEDVDPAPVTFVLEFMLAFPQRREWFRPLMQEIRDLLASPLHDRIGGGIHRAIADPSLGVPHYEKLLRPNAELAAITSEWYRLTRDRLSGAVSASAVRLLNRSFRVGDRTLYAGSLAADLYDPSGREILLHGARYYALGSEERGRYPEPGHSEEIPVGGNFAVVQVLLRLIHSFDDPRLRSAIDAAGSALLREGFLSDGAARRVLGSDAPGNLRDQGEAGSGLLAYHAVTGDPEALEAALRVARVLERDFWNGDSLTFRNVSRRADLPDLIRDSEVDPGWNGIAMRFLAELDAVIGEDRWSDRLERALDRWANRVPVNGTGIAQLGRGALRLHRELPVLLLIADPGDEASEELRNLAVRIFDPLVLVRWIPPDRSEDAMAFGVSSDGAPALHLIWDGASPPIGSPEELEALWDRTRRSVRR